MDLLTSLGSDLTLDQLKINSDLSVGKDIWRDMVEADYLYTLEYEWIQAFLEESNNAKEIVNYFALENYEQGLEGFIGDAWFKFVQFVKKVIAHIKVMFNHFWSGINRKEAYLRNMKIKLRGSSHFNWLKLRDTELIGYNADTFEKVLKICEKIESLLSKLFADNNLDLDDNRDFVIYGIEFEKGLIKKDGVSSQYFYDAKKFDLGIRPNADKALGLVGWNEDSVLRMLDALVEHLKFHNKKDYLFIQFEHAMEALIRRKEHETNIDRDQINRLRNTIQTATSIMLHLTKLINTCTNQMVKMCNILETEDAPKPKQEVEW